MLKYNLLIAIRRLLNNRINASVSILGLAIGLSSVVLMLLYIKYETTYDYFNKDYNRLFRIERNQISRVQNQLWDSSPYPLAKSLKRDFPEIEHAACLQLTSRYLEFGNDMHHEKYGAFADNEFLQLFTFQFIQGNRGEALIRPMNIVVSESLANRLAPHGNLLGKTISIDKKYNFEVSGIFEDIPENSHLKLDYLLSFNSYHQVMGYDENAGWDVNNAKTYVKIINHADQNILSEKILGYLEEQMASDDGNQQLLSLRPIVDIYMKASSVRGDAGKRNEIIVIYLFISVAIFTILISVLNYVNSSTAEVMNRELEIGIKKVLSISKAQLRFQFICESLIVVMIAFLISILLLFLTLPIFNFIVGKSLSIIPSRDWLFILKLFLGVVLVGVLSGLYPAFFLSSLKISSFFQGNASIKRRTTLRKALVILQLTVVMPLIFLSILIIKQINFIQNKDIGFDKYNLLVSRIQTPNKITFEHLKSMKGRLLMDPRVLDFTISSSAPFAGAGAISANWEGGMDNDKVVLRNHQVDYDFLDTYGMELIQGRSFSRDYGADKEQACIINETALRIFGWKDAIGKTLKDGKLKIIGVVKDFNDFSLFMKIPPLVLTMYPENYQAYYASIRVHPVNRTAIQNKINDLFNENFPDNPVEFKFLDADFDATYLNALKEVTKIFIFFSIVAIVLAILGLYSLVSFSLKTQRKMIAVRKVLGANIGSLFLLLLKEYLLLFAIAASLGLVTVYVASFQVMSVLAYHEDVKFNYLILSAVLALLIVLISVSSKIYNASRESPIKALSSE